MIALPILDVPSSTLNPCSISNAFHFKPLRLRFSPQIQFRLLFQTPILVHSKLLVQLLLIHNLLPCSLLLTSFLPVAPLHLQDFLPCNSIRNNGKLKSAIAMHRLPKEINFQ